MALKIAHMKGNFCKLLVYLSVTLSPIFGQFRKAPSFALKDLDGNTVSLDSLLGKGPIIIDFWATWCKPCRMALDMLQDIHKIFADSGLQVLAISVDSPDKINRIKSLVSSKKWTFKVLLDTEKRVKLLYKVIAIPTTFLLDSEGNIVYKRVGYNPREKDELRRKIVELLEPPSDSTKSVNTLREIY